MQTRPTDPAADTLLSSTRVNPDTPSPQPSLTPGAARGSQTSPPAWAEALLELAPVGLFRFDLHGRCLYANPTIARLGGLTPEEARGEGWVRAVHPEDRDRVLAGWAEGVARGEPFGHEFRVRRPDGGVGWVLCRAVPERNPDGTVVGYVGACTDITDRRRAEALRESQNRALQLLATGGTLRDVLDNITRAIEEATPGVLCSVLLFGEDQCLRTGSAPSLPEGYNRAVDGLRIGPAAGSCGTAVHRRAQVVAEDLAADPLWENYRETARRYGLRACWSQPIFGSDGRVLGSFATYARVPRRPGEAEMRLVEVAANLAGIAVERRRDEDALRRSEQKLALHVEQTPLAVIEWTPDFRVAEWNPAAERIFGFTRAEALGREPYGLIISESLRPLAERIRAELLGHRGGTRSTNENLTRDGRVIVCEWYNTALVDPEGRVIGVASLAHDVTERESAKRAMEESEGRYRGLVESTPDAIFVHQAGRVVYANPAATALFGGGRREDLLGRPVLSVVPPEDQQAIQRRINRILETRDPAPLIEQRLLRLDGSPIDVEVVGSACLIHGMPAVQVVARDITERKRAADALRLSEARWRSLAENAPDFITMIDREGRFVFVNRVHERVSRDAVLGNDILAFILEEDRPAFEAALRRVFEEGVSVSVECRAAPGDGQTHWYSSRIGPLRDRGPDGRIEAAVLISTDITERVEVERKVRFQAAVLAEVRDAIVAVDEKGRVTYWNQGAEAIYGYSLADAIGRVAGVLLRPRWPEPGGEDAAKAAFRERGVYHGEVLHTRADGREIYVDAHLSALHGAAGNPAGILGVIRDVTARQEAEARLRRSEEHYRLAAEANQRLLREVNHRVRNNLASLMSLVRLGARRDTDVAAFAAALEARVLALAQVHGMLAAAGWGDMDLRELVSGLLGSMEAAAPGRVEIHAEGPPVALSPRQVLPVAMTLQELFTNSCKYGAHRAASPGAAGRIALAWETSPAPAGRGMRVNLTWRERGGPLVEGPIAPSLGTELIEGFVRHELGGRCTLGFPREGADHHFEFVAEGSPATAGADQLSAPASNPSPAERGSTDGMRGRMKERGSSSEESRSADTPSKLGG